MSSAILQRLPLDMFWPTFDPFLFCAFHNDHYPKGNGQMGPSAPLSGRSLGQDFAGIDGWRMYHGKQVPGFPAHPHRGFETVTIVNKGLVDHADSMGAAGRYGEGDSQWMTAGQGVQHSEMFPLLNEEKDNPVELFQLWLNLPAKSKMVPPHFTMLWNEETPVVSVADEQGIESRIKVIAGDLGEVQALACPPNSWAADKSNGVVIWLIDIPAQGQCVLPAGEGGLNRTLYFFEGSQMQVDETLVASKQALILDPQQALTLNNTGESARVLLLQGKPIDEPVEQHGPFVMNSREELQQAFSDYQQSQFGGWPWPRADQVHDKDKPRFADYGSLVVDD